MLLSEPFDKVKYAYPMWNLCLSFTAQILRGQTLDEHTDRLHSKWRWDDLSLLLINKKT